jgi:hypothetical protein
MTTELSTQNTEIVEAHVGASQKLKAYMDSKEKKVLFNGKRYPEVDDSIYAASFFGLKASSKETAPITIGEQQGFKATAIVVDSNGVQVGSADAFCLNGEPNWARKPLFQLAGMAQTRAINRALLNLLKPVFRLAGVESTPSEEMVEDRPAVQMPKAVQVAPKTEVAPLPVKAGVISDKQRKLIWAKSKAAEIPEEVIKKYFKEVHNVEHTADLPWTAMDAVIKWIDGYNRDQEIPFGD